MFFRSLVTIAAAFLSQVAFATEPTIVIKTISEVACDNFNCTVVKAKITGENEVTYFVTPEIEAAFEKANQLLAQVASGEISELSRPHQSVVSAYMALKGTAKGILDQIQMQFCPMDVRAPVALYNSYNILFNSTNDVTIFNSLQQSVLGLFVSQIIKLETLSSCNLFHELKPVKPEIPQPGIVTIAELSYRFDAKYRVANLRESIFEALKTNFEVIENRLQDSSDIGSSTPTNQALMGLFMSITAKEFEWGFKAVQVPKDVAQMFDTTFSDIAGSVTTNTGSLTPTQQTVIAFFNTALSK